MTSTYTRGSHLRRERGYESWMKTRASWPHETSGQLSQPVGWISNSRRRPRPNSTSHSCVMKACLCFPRCWVEALYFVNSENPCWSSEKGGGSLLCKYWVSMEEFWRWLRPSWAGYKHCVSPGEVEARFRDKKGVSEIVFIQTKSILLITRSGKRALKTTNQKGSSCFGEWLCSTPQSNCFLCPVWTEQRRLTSPVRYLYHLLLGNILPLSPPPIWSWGSDSWAWSACLLPPGLPQYPHVSSGCNERRCDWRLRRRFLLVHVQPVLQSYPSSSNMLGVRRFRGEFFLTISPHPNNLVSTHC